MGDRAGNGHDLGRRDEGGAMTDEEHTHDDSHSHEHEHDGETHSHPHDTHEHEHVEHEHEHSHGDVTHSHPHTHQEGLEEDHATSTGLSGGGDRRLAVGDAAVVRRQTLGDQHPQRGVRARWPPSAPRGGGSGRRRRRGPRGRPRRPRTRGSPRQQWPRRARCESAPRPSHLADPLLQIGDDVPHVSRASTITAPFGSVVFAGVDQRHPIRPASRRRRPALRARPRPGPRRSRGRGSRTARRRRRTGARRWWWEAS